MSGRPYRYRTRLLPDGEWMETTCQPGSFAEATHHEPLEAMKMMGVDFMLIRGTDRLDRPREWSFDLLVTAEMPPMVGP